MKGRPFLAVVLAVVLLTFSLGLGGWWLIGQRGPLQLAHHALTIPRAARFVPAQAPLSLYWFSDGEQPVAYARAVAPARQRRPAADGIARLRDGAFAAAGLDYHDELSQWLAPGTALVLFDDPAGEQPAAGGLPSGGWLLALASRDDEGARRFLQRFWQTRSLAGTDLQVSSYRGMGLISGRGALVGSRSVPLATALVEDDLVLIASGRGVLERALDVSQIAELNQASQPGLQEQLDQLGEGAALLLARPQALEQWLGWPLPAAAAQRPTQLLASLRPEGRTLLLHGHLQLPAPSGAIAAVSLAPVVTRVPSDTLAASESPAGPGTPAPPNTQEPLLQPPPLDASSLQPADPVQQQQLLAGLRGQLTSLLLLQDPAAQLRQPLLQPLVQRALARTTASGPLPVGAAPGGDGAETMAPAADAAPAAGRKRPGSSRQGRDVDDPRRGAGDQRPLSGPRSAAGAFPLLVAQRAAGPLLVAAGPAGWQLGTARDQPAPELLEPALAAQGLIQAPLELGDRSLQVWTRLESRGQRGGKGVGKGGAAGDTLQAPLAAWRQASGSLAWWGRNLAVLDQPAASRGSQELQAALQALDHAEAPLQWVLSAVPSRQLLRAWQPWQLLSALAGGGLDDAVRGLAVALEPEGHTLHLQARLSFER
ncbi:MAG: DUF3352 domain-containing protein [Cyanobacteria bacterium]|nr:DUF3352 domain-containing protein [Cyanobacteriota bacterium]